MYFLKKTFIFRTELKLMTLYSFTFKKQKAIVRCFLKTIVILLRLQIKLKSDFFLNQSIQIYPKFILNTVSSSNNELIRQKMT